MSSNPDVDVLVLGYDGYSGWPLTCRLLDHDYTVAGIDNKLRRDLAGDSVTPIEDTSHRVGAAIENFDGDLYVLRGDITHYSRLLSTIDNYEPDTIINLAQLPSAPYSMQDVDAAWHVHENNVKGSLNLYHAIHSLDLDTHVVQLATMGEYGTPNAEIPEGFQRDGQPAPKDPGSLYHASKVATTTNTLFLARTWDIPTTEIYQGIVYGVTTNATWRDDRLFTRFDCDSVWGTVVNRFTAQTAINEPVTVYGGGGQKRAMLSLQDCVRCLHLAVEHPPDAATPYQAVNQFDDAYRVRDIANYLRTEHDADIHHIENPRVEDDGMHRYDVEQHVLDDWGYTPTRSIEAEIDATLTVLKDYTDRIDAAELEPDVSWR